MSYRLKAAVGLSAMAAFVGMVAMPASASTAQPASAHQPAAAHAVLNAPFDEETCNGDVCFRLVWDGTSNHFQIHAGANANSFTGYFHFSGPGGPFDPANSPTRTWAAHGLANGSDYDPMVKKPPQDGTYCMNAFQDGVSIGKTCITYP